MSSRFPIRCARALIARPAVLAFAFRPLSPDAARVLGEMLNTAPVELLREGARLLAGYRPEIPVLCPIYAIHGNRDRLMRPPTLPHCRKVDDAGHALALTHPQDVTRFLQETLGLSV